MDKNTELKSSKDCDIYITAMELHLYFLCVTCDLNIVGFLLYLGMAESEIFSLARKDIKVGCICVTQGQVYISLVQ